MSEHRRIERETDDEIRAHLANRVDDLVARGMPRRQAEEEALRRFGPLDTSRAELVAAARHRDRVLTMYDRLDALSHDFRYALRQIRRAPLLAATVIATFALGVGANATMFGLLDRLLLRAPAHVRAPEQVVRVQSAFHRRGESVTSAGFSYPAYAAVRDHVAGFSSVAMQTFPNPLSFGLGADAHPVQDILVSGNYFSTLGVGMVIGRPILPEDDVLPNGSPVVVIGYGLWQREFGGNSNVLGKTVNLAGRQYTIIGVAPRDFVSTGTTPIDVWIPVSAAEGLRFAGADWATDYKSSWMTLVARLAPGVTPEAAGEQVAATLRAFNQNVRGKRDTTTFATAQASILPSSQKKLSAERRVAVLLGAVSVLVLLIACANVANLLLARALRRRREIAVRLALGVSRARLVRQLTIEGLVLAALGGVAALLVVQLGSAVMYRTLLSGYARPSSFIDLRVCVFTITAAIGVGIATSLIPAWQASRPDLTRDLKEGTRGAGLSHSRTRTGLLLVQAALSVVLLTGAGAFVLSLRKVNSVNLGMDMDRLVMGHIDLRSVGIDSIGYLQYFNDLVTAARRLPGVADATIGEAAPFTNWTVGISPKAPGRDSLPDFEEGPYRHGVGDDYFKTTGTRILRGRGLEADDFVANAEPVLVINDDAARRIWPGEEAVGKCLFIDGKDAACLRIVGVAQDTHRSNVVEKGSRMQVYNPVGRGGHLEQRSFALIVRAKTDPASIVEPVRHLMQTVHSGLPYANVTPMTSALDLELRPWRLGSTLFGVFGAIALALSALGLYSVVG
jgi:predicted permease